MRRLFQIFGFRLKSNVNSTDNVIEECKNSNDNDNDNDDSDDGNNDSNDEIKFDEYEVENNNGNEEEEEDNDDTIFSNTDWLQSLESPDDDNHLDWSTSLLPFPTIIKRKHSNKKGHVPILEWNNTDISTSARIVYPQPLSDAQLSVSVRNVLNLEVNGKVVFNPPRGTILKAGMHEIMAIFIPQNPLHYRSISITKIIKVVRGTPKLLWLPPFSELSVGIGLNSGLPKEFLNCKCPRLKGGKFYYTHKPGAKLDRGYRKIGVRYEPSEKNSKNYKHGFLQVTLHITGFIPDMDWPPIKALNYPLKISKLHYNVRPKDQILGTFKYQPPLNTLFSVGIYELTATFLPEDTYRYMQATCTNTIEIIKGVPSLDWPQPVSVYEETVLNERILRCSCTNNIKGVFDYDPLAGTILKPGTIILRAVFTPIDLQNYEVASTEVRLTVHNKMKPLVNWEEPDFIVHPAPLARSELNAEVSGHIRGRFIYDPPYGTILSAGIHDLKVKFISETVGKSDSEGFTRLDVRKGVSRLLWDAPYPVLEGQPITSSVLNCVCTNNIKGTFTYNIRLGSILSAGRHKLHVRFEPDEESCTNFFGAETTQILEVRTRGKKRPTITWSNPADIQHPQPLTEVHLNAVCSAHGQLNYFPSLDTILDIGEHILSVSFLPLHKDICLPVSGEVTIRVIPGVPKLKWNPLSNFIYGQELTHEHLNAECNCCDGEMEYDPDFKTILDSGGHTLFAKFYPDTPNYLPTEITASILIQRGTAIVEWTPQLTNTNDKNLKIEYPFFINQDAHLNAKVIYPKNAKGKFKYSVQPNDILNAGTHSMKCRFYPDDIINMYSGDSEIIIEVEKGLPRIQWKTGLKEHISYGIGLNTKKHYGTKMLSVIDGRMSYDPPLNYVLDVGEHTLNVTFTPNDLNNYNPVTISRIVKVNDLTL